MESVDFEHWFPIRIYRGEGGLRVHWFRSDDTLRFDDRYFHDTVSRAAKRPFNLAFSRHTGIEPLIEVSRGESLPVRGMIFHLSRCGSTLVSSAFALRADTLVLSEPGPFNDVLTMPELAREERVALLRAVAAVLARAQRPQQRYCVIKLDAWHARSVAVIEEAFPKVPWIFLHRNPHEVLVSHLRVPSLMMSGANAPATLGIPVTQAMRFPRDAYCAAVLAAILDAVRARNPDEAALIDYRELPQAVWTRVGPRFQMPFGEHDIARVRAAAQYHAKDPQRLFSPDSDEKRLAASAVDLHILAQLGQAYEWLAGDRANGRATT